MSDAPKTAAQAIIAVMRDIDAISKSRENTMQHYKFRGIDEVYNELHFVMAKHGLFTVPRVVTERHEERTSKNGGLNIYRILGIEFDFTSESGDKITVGPIIGEGMDSGDKAANKAHAVAHKYALIQVFAIPTSDEKDPENDSHDLVPQQKPQQQPQQPQQAPANPAPGQFCSIPTKCEKIENPGKRAFYVVHFGNSKASTFSETIYANAQAAQAQGLHCRFSVVKNGNFSNLEWLEIEGGPQE